MTGAPKNNRFNGVFGSRIEPPDSLDDFPTQPWGTRALLMMLKRRSMPALDGKCWEPAANRGFMVKPLTESFGIVHGSDVFDYRRGFEVRDFLVRYTDDDAKLYDWIITNPPFRLGEEFALTAYERARVGCAVLSRMPFLESIGRYERMYQNNRPTFVFQFVERLPIVQGRCVAVKENGERQTTSTAYCWLVWDKRSKPVDTIFDWIPPCRARLERADDYEGNDAAAEPVDSREGS